MSDGRLRTGLDVVITLSALIAAAALSSQLQAMLGLTIIDSEPLVKVTMFFIALGTYTLLWICCFALYELVLTPGKLLRDPSPDGLPLPLNVLLFILFLLVVIGLWEFLLEPTGVSGWLGVLVAFPVFVAFAVGVLRLYDKVFIGEPSDTHKERVHCRCLIQPIGTPQCCANRHLFYARE